MSLHSYVRKCICIYTSQMYMYLQIQCVYINTYRYNVYVSMYLCEYIVNVGRVSSGREMQIKRETKRETTSLRERQRSAD